MSTARRNPFLLLLTGILVACGGGSPPSTGPSGNTAPAVSIKASGRAITANTYLPSGGRLEVSVSDPDMGGSIKKVVYSIDNGTQTELTPSAAMILPLPVLAAEPHQVTVEATDNVGAVTTVKASFLVDDAAPTLGTITLNGQAAASTATLTVGDAALLSVSAQDTRGDAQNTAGPVTIRILEGDTLLKSVSGASTTVDVTKASGNKDRTAGIVILTVEAEDSVGFVTSRNIAVTFNAAIDNSAITAPTFTWLSPASDYVQGGGTVTLRATATRNGQDVSSQITYTATCGTIVGNIWTLGTDCADGSKQSITATVTDGGRSFSSPAKVITVDASDPTVQITSPQQGQSFTQNPIKISVAGTDAVSGLDRILVEAGKVEADNKPIEYVQVGVITAASGEVTWAPMNGTYTLRATATDRTGRTSSTTLGDIKVNLTSNDATPPTVSITPIPAAPQRATVTIIASASDKESGVAKVDLYDGGTLIESKAAGVGGKYIFSLDTTRLSDGTHTLRAIAFDNAGLSSETSASLIIDNTAPVINWISPADASVTGGEVTLNATTSEGAVVYTVDGVTLTGSRATFTSDGAHTITATAQDEAGNRSTSTIKVTSDATAPTVQIISPTTSQKFTTTPISIGVVGQDSGTGVANIRVHADDGTGTRELIGTSSGSGTVTWYPRKTDGKTSYKIIATAADRAGNTSETEISNVQVQTASNITLVSGPSITVPDANPRGATSSTDGRLYVRGPLLVNANATSNAPSMAQAELQLDGQTRASNLTTPGTPTFNFDFDTLNEGLHDVGVRFTDSLGTVGSTKASVFVDKSGPVITWNSPLSGSLSQTPVTPSATAIDNASGLAGAVTFTENGAAVTGPVKEGQHTVTAVATDNVGNISTRAITFTVDMTGPEVVPTSPTDTQEFSSAPITLSASASDNLSGVAFMEAKVGVQGGQPLTTLGRQSGSTYSAVYTPTQTGTYVVEYTAWDAAGNVSGVVKRTFRYSVTTPPVEQAPNPVLEVIGSAPFSGNISVNVSGNFDTGSQIDRMILQVTDAKGVIDNSSYVTTQARATFSVDTTRFANGLLKLEVIAIARSGLLGRSKIIEAGVQNLTSPDLKVATPSDGATITTPTVPVQITLTKRSADYSVNGSNIVVDVLDYRGVSVRSQTLSINNPSICTGSAESMTCNTSFDVAALPADIYTIRVRANVQVDPSGANITRALETNNRFTHNTISLLPPAASIRFPAITDFQKPGQLDSSSGILISVSDNTGVSVVEARIVGPFDGTQPLTLNGTTQCDASTPVPGRSPVDVLMLNYGYTPAITNGDVVLRNFDIDGSAYIPNNNANERYDLRVTVQDTEGNRNIQCIPITVNRAASQAARPAYVVSTAKLPNPPSTIPGDLNYTTGTWSLSGMTNNSRVAAVLYQDNIQKNATFDSGITNSKDVTVSFGDPGTYQIVWLVEDMTTGVVTSVSGEVISVVKIPSP